MRSKRLCIAAALVFAVLTLSSCSAAGDKSAKDGRELYRQGSYSEALECLSAAEEKGVKSFNEAELYNCIGNCYYRLGDYDKCIDYQMKCLDIDPEYFKGWVNLGVAYKKLDENDKAMTCYEVALNYDPENSDSAPLYISLGALYIERGKPISSITYLEKAKVYYPDSADIYANLAIAYKMALEPEMSEQALDMAKQLGYDKIDEVQERLDKIE